MEIVIKKPIKKPKSVYVLEIEYMHGDGDATTYREIEFEDVEELKEILEVLFEAKKTYDPEKYESVLKKRNLKMDDWLDYFDDDSTCQGYWASIQNIVVKYFDENGIEHETVIKNGKDKIN